MTTQNTSLSQFITKRDGFLDDDYNDQLIALEHELAKREAITAFTAKVSATALKIAHKAVLGTLNALDTYISSANA